jgi:hypothetical protein
MCKFYLTYNKSADYILDWKIVTVYMVCTSKVAAEDNIPINCDSIYGVYQ